MVELFFTGSFHQAKQKKAVEKNVIFRSFNELTINCMNLLHLVTFYQECFTVSLHFAKEILFFEFPAPQQQGVDK